LLTFTIPLLLAYTVMIGLTFANMGIIARQRTPLFPLLFMVLAVASLAAQPLGRPVPISEEPLEHDYRVAVP
ncbi:MAG TPA: hypothetical protein VMT16_07610, partial [Thermoanaerobaculia bacterium]|nr:hypothetical protein [Thermoanaerobaculia bacterium]